MVFDPELAEIRFGCGLSPSISPLASREAMLARLQGPDRAAEQFPIAGTETILASVSDFARLRKLRRTKAGSSEAKQAEKDFKRFRRKHLQQRDLWFRQLLLRHVTTQDSFRERLTLFWADHFTAKGKNRAMQPLAYGYIESAIRPNISSRFEDLLIAAVTNPLMLHYLDQFRSRGENSALNKRQGGRGGLNENLAREVLELHTLGLEGPYDQADVRQLAELFTGLSYRVNKGFLFDEGMAEPGAETVLGRVYGGAEAELEPVLQALRDLARHPATADHIAWKLAVHFTKDQPAPELVAALSAAYRDSDGDLAQVYDVLLNHELSWEPELGNVKPPFDYMASACRGLGVDPAHLTGWKPKQMRQNFIAPLRLMGQAWQSPVGPDGWEEADAAWITPQGLSARLRWAMAAPRRLVEALPDPTDFAGHCLGSRANPWVMFVASAAETRAEAIGLVLSSPAFQRR
ncbi:DUF1800 family protein [Pseudophaeobacter sp. EL27]|uniref:DUF1800 domain-containing protein n=1 Tax=Pseudophaeobacter sp. EL27 TaxID=2107580 RepID=UPI000EFC96A6|nr:DUF1800 domain-containing protein [Pseudophaeobacter sp. EL27]